MMKELTIKNTIDQAEKELYEVLWKNLQPLRLGDNTIAHIQKPLEMYISTYTKDLLQSVESKLDVLDTCLEGLPMAGDGLITQKLYASDVVERLKEVKADIISKL